MSAFSFRLKTALPPRRSLLSKTIILHKPAPHVCRHALRSAYSAISTAIWAGRFAYLAGVVQCYRGLELVSSSKELVFSAGDGLDLQVIERQNDHTVMVVAWW